MRGSVAVARGLSERFGLPAGHIGSPEPALNTDWRTELDAALPALREMSSAYERLMSGGLAPLTALSRCSVALATLPVVARHRPDACVVWFDAHADLNTPDNTTTGYLGGMALSGAAGLWDSGLGGDLRLDGIVLGGARDVDPPEQALIDGGAVRSVPQGPDLADALRSAIASRPVYFHLDCDVLEPGIVPTDYRVPGGLSLADLHAVSEVVAEGELVGLEIGEFEASWPEGAEPVVPDALLDAMAPMYAALTAR
ncbi:arginase family protein [Saccharopolyspora erythraea]|uniref:arginase family protein n=1 Tax=Saccharopolyspora erythraea TaxID=1836 RepID=UPI0020125901|nr:arginase family protein [Saccharopolyspora erythraea]